MSEGNPIAKGSICHVEVPAPDPERMQAFYGAVFGWEFTPMGPGYLLFRAGDTGGGLDPTMPVAEGGPVLVLAVDDIDQSLADIAANGGEGLTPKTQISEDHGYYAYFRDPCGNKMGVWSST
jgi:predicted enzyme related to lactoylglutathione lyase